MKYITLNERELELNMKEIVKDIRRWQKQEKKIAVARVIDLDGSGPRLPGAAMAVTEEGEVAGSVS